MTNKDHPDHPAVEKLRTGISSLDIIAKGGLPKNRTTLISGTAGSGKTVFAVHFLAAGIAQGEPGVFVTFEESAEDVRKNMKSFGWDLAAWEQEGKLTFVDASPDPDIETVEAGGFDLGALLARVQNAVNKVKARRVSVDSLGAVFSQFTDQAMVRGELFRIASALNVRISSGNKDLDEMCGGGFFRDSVTLVSGATGTGKTLTVTQFLQGGVANGEKCLLLAFEESRDQLVRNATGWGFDFEKMEHDGLLRVVCDYPDLSGLEDWLVTIQKIINEFGPQRVALDSLSALENVGTLKAFREFVIGLTSFIKHREITGMFTATTGSLMGGDSITESNISTLTDSIVLLRYVEMFGEMKRGITVLKMRGSGHDKAIREFTIGKGGMQMGRPFRNVTGIIGGAPMHVSPGDVERIWMQYDKEVDRRRPEPRPTS